MASTCYYNHIIPVYLAVSRHGPPAMIWEEISILFFGSLGMQCMAVAVSWAWRWQGLIWFSLSKCPGQDNQLSRPGGWVRRLQTSDLRKTRWDFSHLPSLAKGSGAYIKITWSSWQCFWLWGTSCCAEKSSRNSTTKAQEGVYFMGHIGIDLFALCKNARLLFYSLRNNFGNVIFFPQNFAFIPKFRQLSFLTWDRGHTAQELPSILDKAQQLVVREKMCFPQLTSRSWRLLLSVGLISCKEDGAPKDYWWLLWLLADSDSSLQFFSFSHSSENIC